MGLSKFCRLELMSRDVEKAAFFYARAFGWRATAEPDAAEEAYFWLKNREGEAIGGLYQMSPDLRRQGAPSHWQPQLRVADAAATLALAKELGAKVTSDLFNLFDVGQLALLQDPTGAPFGLWQGTEADSAAAWWCELSTPSLGKARAFYEGLCGWNTEPMSAQARHSHFQLLVAGEDPVGALLELGPKFTRVPAHWLVYVPVPNLAEATAAVEKAGGRVIAPARGVGEMPPQAVAQDPTGAVFGLIQEQ